MHRSVLELHLMTDLCLMVILIILQKWIAIFTTYGAKVKIIYLEVPYEQLLSQNHHRDHKVPEKVIDKMIKRLEIPRFEEAHELEFLTEH